MNDFFIYVFTNRTKTIFNVGMTSNLGAKLSEVGDSEFERKIKSFYLLYYKAYPSMKLAKEAESVLRRMSRIKQEQEIKAMNPRLIFLNPLFTETSISA